MIPSFDISGVLPPYLNGDPTNPLGMSPYASDMSEVCAAFSSSRERIGLLRGLIAYRQMLDNLGIQAGFQWLDGSFVENIEITESRNPADIDVITYFRRPNGHQDDQAWGNFFSTNKDAFSTKAIKPQFNCDAYYVDLDLHAEAVVDHTRYWFGLFSHKRATNQWKGILQIPLNSAQDNAALAILAAKEAQL